MPLSLWFTNRLVKGVEIQTEEELVEMRLVAPLHHLSDNCSRSKREMHKKKEQNEIAQR